MLESWVVSNLTSDLLRADSEFCSRSFVERRDYFTSWREKLSTAMAGHRANNAFAVFAERYESPCAQSEKSPAVRRAAMLLKMPPLNHTLAVRVQYGTARHIRLVKQTAEGGCARSEQSTHYSSEGLISSFGNDTALLLAITHTWLTADEHPAAGCTSGSPSEDISALANALPAASIARAARFRGVEPRLR